MSVIGFKDILVCSLVSDVQNVSWSKPIWVAQIQLTSSGSVWGLRADGISVWTVSVSVWRDSWLQAFPSDSLPLPFLSISLSLSLSWQQDFLSVPGHRAPTFPMQPVIAGSASTHRSRRAPPAWSASVCVCVCV